MADDKIGFSLRKVTTEQFAIIESAYKKDETISLNLNTRYGFNVENKIITIFFSPAFYQKKSPFLVLEIGCDFNIKEGAWESFFNKDKSILTVPAGFIRHLIMLTIGTARGVLHSKTENTPFNEFLLPTLNVNELVKEDIVFKIDTVTE